MIILDLKLTLFLLLLVLLAGLGAARRLLQRSQSQAQPVTQVEALLERLPFGLLLLNPDGQIIFANTPAQQILTLLRQDSSHAAGLLLHQAGILTPALVPRNGRLSPPVPVRWWCYPLEGGHTLLALLDEADQQHALRRQQLFINQLLHELRTPLTALVAHIEIMRSPETSASLHQTSLETIGRETQRLTRLVRDMLELYRLETSADLPLQPTDLVLVAEDAIASLILQAEECGLRLSFDTDAALPRVLAHPDRLRQVFVNLLDNAIKYCRPEDTIRVCLAARDEEVVCSVQDSGPGIPAADLPHVTEQLYRGRTDVAGIGMGLALAGAIVRQHQSTLVITSSAAGATTGTTCRWSLRYAAPLERSAGAPAHALPDQPQSPLDQHQPATHAYEEVV